MGVFFGEGVCGGDGVLGGGALACWGVGVLGR